MGADAAAGRHDGTPPGEDEIAARMRAGGLRPHGWGNGPGDTYIWRKHGYERVLYCVRGQIMFHTPAATSSWYSRAQPANCISRRRGRPLHRSTG